MKPFIAVVFAGALAVAGCRKDAGQTADTEAPVIRLASPANNQIFGAGQPVSVSGTLTDNVKLQGMHVEIVNLTTGVFITHEHFPVTGTSYDFSKAYSLQAGASYRVKVEAEDNSGNDVQATVTVTLN